jgi:hypothetical protein
MTDQDCPQESAIRRAVDGDGWTDHLRQHVSRCASCGEVVEVSHFMKDAARAMEREAVPDAHGMWARIQLEERQSLDERALRPVRLAWMFAKGWLACGAALILYREWPFLDNFFLTMPPYLYVAVAAVVAIALRSRRMMRG